MAPEIKLKRGTGQFYDGRLADLYSYGVLLYKLRTGKYPSEDNFDASKGENNFIIIEGIFAHRLNLNYQKTINVVCEEEKELCFHPEP